MRALQTKNSVVKQKCQNSDLFNLEHPSMLFCYLIFKQPRSRVPSQSYSGEYECMATAAAALVQVRRQKMRAREYDRSTQGTIRRSQAIYIWLVHIYPARAWLVCALGRLQTISTSKQIGKNIGRVRDSEAGSILFHFFCQNFICGGFHNRSVQLQWILLNIRLTSSFLCFQYNTQQPKIAYIFFNDKFSLCSFFLCLKRILPAFRACCPLLTCNS